MMVVSATMSRADTQTHFRGTAHRHGAAVLRSDPLEVKGIRGSQAGRGGHTGLAIAEVVDEDDIRGAIGLVVGRPVAIALSLSPFGAVTKAVVLSVGVGHTRGPIGAIVIARAPLEAAIAPLELRQTYQLEALGGLAFGAGGAFRPDPDSVGLGRAVPTSEHEQTRPNHQK